METAYHKLSKSLVVLTDEKIKEIKTNGNQSEYFKILALPEHFSPQQLQIVDGKLKEGKCLVECEKTKVGAIDAGKFKNWSDAGTSHEISIVKLNPHITIYNVEEKMYKESELPIKQIGEVLKYLEDQSVYDKMSKWNDPYYKLKKWFEQNIKD